MNRHLSSFGKFITRKIKFDNECNFTPFIYLWNWSVLPWYHFFCIWWIRDVKENVSTYRQSKHMIWIRQLEWKLVSIMAYCMLFEKFQFKPVIVILCDELDSLTLWVRLKVANLRLLHLKIIIFPITKNLIYLQNGLLPI